MAKKIIAVGDYLKKIDGVVEFEVPDQDNPQEKVFIPVRVKRASPRDSMKVMEFVNTKMGGKTSTKKFDEMSTEEKNEAINLSYLYDAMLISATCFLPPVDYDPDHPDACDLSVETEKVWPTMDAVLDNNSTALFDKIRAHVGSQREVLTDAEAKK